MTEIVRGRVPRSVDLLQIYTGRLGAGQIATNGVQYSAVVTIGATEVLVFNQLIDPGFELSLKELQVGLTQRFTENTGGTTAGTISYVWDARSEWHDPVGTYRTTSYVGLVPTLAKGVTSGANSEDTLSGYLPVASLPKAPVRLRLKAKTLYANGFKGQVRNISFIRMVGTVIPGS
jgi:hypothetical protein